MVKNSHQPYPIAKWRLSANDDVDEFASTICYSLIKALVVGMITVIVDDFVTPFEWCEELLYIYVIIIK